MIQQQQYDNQLDRFKNSFLMAAAKGGRTHEVASLLELGANVNGTDVNEEDNSMSNVSYSGNVLDENIQIIEDSPLLAAVTNGHLEVASLLLAHGASTKFKTRDGGNRGLHLAAMTGSEDMCRLVIVADIGQSNDNVGSRDLLNYTNDDGMTPFDIAVERGFLALAEKLKGHVSGLLNENSLFGQNIDYENEEEGNFGDSSSFDEEDSLANLDDDEIRDRFLALVARERGEEEEEDSRRQDIATLHDDSEDDDFEVVQQNPSFFREKLCNNGNIDQSSSDIEETQLENIAFTPIQEPVDQIENQHNNFTHHSNRLESQVKMLKGLVEKLHTKNMVLKESEKTNQMVFKSTEMALAALEKKCSILETERNEAQGKLGEMMDGSNMNNQTLDDLEVMEARLRKVLSAVVAQKEILVKNKLAEEEDKRSCVICQIQTKTVLLMPCRHMCVCKDCSMRSELRRCPLCRQDITEKIDVFA